MSPVWLLPVVTLIVASSSGGVLAQAIGPVSPSHALLTITFSIFLVSVGLSLALMILTIYLYRMILYGPPQDMSVISTFVPLGPTGQAGFSIILIGENLKELLPVANSSSPFLGSTSAGDIVYTVCICIAFILWSLATMWLIFALLSIQSVVRKTRFPFRIRFWGMIFPNVSTSAPRISPLACLLSTSFLGRLCELDDHVLPCTRRALLPNVGCHLCRAHVCCVVHRLHSDSHDGPHWGDICGAMSGRYRYGCRG